MAELVDKKHEVLRTPATKFDFLNPPINPVELYNTLGSILKEKNGLGLAAPQIGYGLRVFVVRANPILPFFNPVIVDKSEEEVTLEEGCLTFPGILVKIKRPRVIKVRFADPMGQYQTKVFQDLTARVIQHEVDHLDGILIGNRVGPVSLERAVKAAAKNGHPYLIGDLK